MVEKSANYSQYDFRGEKSLEEALEGLSQFSLISQSSNEVEE